MTLNLQGVIALSIGVLTLVGALLDWNWMMEHHKAEIFVKLFGRDGARVFYALLGMAIFVLGLFVCEFRA